VVWSWRLAFLARSLNTQPRLSSSYSLCARGWQMAKEHELQRRNVEDVLGGAEAWANADRTQISCPECGHDKAYFMQVQIRSAEEPLTVFYKCSKPACGYRWKEG
jgi:DNA-directed RNA polymerase subunit M/transcription elongation factor TFIIS